MLPQESSSVYHKRARITIITVPSGYMLLVMLLLLSFNNLLVGRTNLAAPKYSIASSTQIFNKSDFNAC